MSRRCGARPRGARHGRAAPGATAPPPAAALGRPLTVAALLAAQGALAAAGGPHGAVPEGYNLEEVPTPLGPGGDAVELEVGVNSFPYDFPKPDCIAGKIELPLRVWIYWYDPRLVFPVEVSNRTGVAGSSVSIDPGAIWTPDLEVSERMGQQECTEGPAVLYDLAFSEQHPLVDRGFKYNVMWPRSCTMTTRCDCNLVNFPFDEHTCNITWIPLAERGYKVVDAGHLPDVSTVPRLADGSGDYKMGPKIDSVEFTYWFLTDGSPTVQYFDRIAPKFHTLGERQANRKLIHFQRAPEYFVVNFLCPTMILVFMEWFTFLVPLEKADRVAYGVTLLLANIATQFITADRRPPEKSNTWIDLFSAASLILIVYPILITVILLRYSEFLGRKVRNITDPEKKEAYESHVNGLIAGVDRVSRLSYPIIVVVVYAYVFTTPLYGSRDKTAELLDPLVVKLILFVFVVPTTMLLMWFSITSLVMNGSGIPDRKYVLDLMLDRELSDDGDELRENTSEDGDGEQLERKLIHDEMGSQA